MLLEVFKKIYFLKVRLRTAMYGLLLAKFGEGSQIFGSIKIINPENIFVGKNSTLNEGVFLNARGKIVIGDCVHISPYCILNTGGLVYEKFLEERAHLEEPITIKNGVWLGSGVIINPGVIIGENCVIGAGAVVTSDIPLNSVAFGVPAKVVKTITS